MRRVHLIDLFLIITIGGVEKEQKWPLLTRRDKKLQHRQDSTDGKAAALYPEDLGSNPFDSFFMLQHALANNE